MDEEWGAKYIAHVGAVTKNVSTNTGKENFLHFSPLLDRFKVSR